MDFPSTTFAGKGQLQLKGGTESTSAAGIAPAPVLQGPGRAGSTTAWEKNILPAQIADGIFNNHILNRKQRAKRSDISPDSQRQKPIRDVKAPLREGT